MLKEIKTRGDIILFIDELHTLVGAGAAEGAIDAAVDPQADAGPRRAADHRRHHARRVPQAPREGRRPRAPLPADQGRGAHRGPHHRDPQGPARPLRDRTTGSPSPTRRWWPRPTWPTATSPTGTCPDKAIDLIDEAGSRLRIKRMQTPPDYKELENEIAEVVRQKKEAVEAQHFEEAGRLRDQEKELLGREGAARRPRSRRRRRPLRRGRRGGHRRGALDLDGHPRLQAHRGGDGQAPPHGGRAPQAGHRPGGRHQGRLPGHPPHPGRPQGPQAPVAARSSSWAPPASARPSWPRRSPSSCSATSRP